MSLQSMRKFSKYVSDIGKNSISIQERSFIIINETYLKSIYHHNRSLSEAYDDKSKYGKIDCFNRCLVTLETKNMYKEICL